MTKSPSRSNPNLPLSLPQQILIDALCDEFEGQLQTAESPRIEDFLARLPEDIQGFALRELLGLEIDLRKQAEVDAGKVDDADDYRRRFPSYQDVVDAVLQKASSHKVTDIFLQVMHVSQEKRAGNCFSEAATQNKEPGMKWSDRYEILGTLGKGGDGIVYRAYDKEEHREVAVKVPKQGLATDADINEFLKQARAASNLKHKGLVKVLNFGCEGQQPYIVQELIV